MGRRAVTDEEWARGAALGARIAELRGQVTQEEVAVAAGINVDALRKVEQGRVAGPSVFLVADVADALQRPIGDLLSQGDH